MMPGFKKENEYQKLITPELYRKTPKAVFAAIVASVGSNGGDMPEEVDGFIMEEWSILHHNGIVPQKPPKTE